MYTFVERLKTVSGVIIAWFTYSTSYWNVSGLKVLKQRDPTHETRVTALETIILIASTIIHLRWSGVADRFSCRVVLWSCVLIAVLPLLSNTEFEHSSKMEYLVVGIQHLVCSCSLTLTIPASTKLFLSKFKREWLNLASSFIKFSETSARAFIRILVLLLFYDEEHLQLYSVTVGATSLVLFWLPFTVWRGGWNTPCVRNMRNRGVENLTRNRMMFRVAVCGMFLQLSRELVTYLMKNGRIIDDESEILASMSGIFLAVLLSVMFRDVGVMIYASMLNVFCLGMGGLCLGMALCGQFPKRIFVSLFGAYFTVAEVFLQGSMAASLGEIDGSIAKSVGTVHGFGNIGRLVALIALNVFPNYILLILAITISFLYSYSLYGLRMYVVNEKQLFLP